jgi:hypothetical protein
VAPVTEASPAIPTVAPRARTAPKQAPVALLSLITDERQFFKSATGLPDPWATRRAVPQAQSICRHVVETGAALVVDDVRRDPLLRTYPSVRDLGWTVEVMGGTKGVVQLDVVVAEL